MITCALLAIILVAGLEVLNIHTAANNNRMAVLQMEQLYRSALSDSLEYVNQSGAIVQPEQILLSDEPLPGQKRFVKVAAVNDSIVTITIESCLTDGGKRRRQVQWLMLPVEERMAFSRPRCVLFNNGQWSDVSNRWLQIHAQDDCVILCHGHCSIGTGASLHEPLQGSLYVMQEKDQEQDQEKIASLHTDLTVKNHVVFTGNCQLHNNLNCKNAYIDGTLTIGEGVRLHADAVYLGTQVAPEVLKRIEAQKIYGPSIPAEEKTEETENKEAAEKEEPVLPLPELPLSQSAKMKYLML